MTEPAGNDLFGAEQIRLWPQGVLEQPAGLQTVIMDSGSGRDRCLRGVADPWLSVFRPEKPNGKAVLLAPGGAYCVVMVDNESIEVAKWLAGAGYHVFVLFYRLPGEGWANRTEVSVADARRAVRIIKARARGCGFSPDRVIAMGFSAGGHLCAHLATGLADKVPALADADAHSASIWLNVLVYPVIQMHGPDAHMLSHQAMFGELSERERGRRSLTRAVHPDMAPHLLIHAEDDSSVPVSHALAWRAALRKAGVPVTTHLFESGEHGFGIRRIAGTPLAAWPELFAKWVASHEAAAREAV